MKGELKQDLTPREKEIVGYICQGLKDKQIAERMGIAPNTVKLYVKNVYEKTGIHGRTLLALYFQKEGTR